MGDYLPGVQAGQVICESCGSRHEATPHHEGRFGEGTIYEVTCTVDWLASYYTSEALV